MKDVIEESARSIIKKEAVNQLSDSVRVEFLRAVAEGYTKELSHNISQYVKSLEAASVEISSENYGEKLMTSLQRSVKTLEHELEKQGPDSPVIVYLKEKYKEGQTTSLIGRKSSKVYETIPGFSFSAWRDQPWLNRIISDSPEIGEILAKEASRLFDELFVPPEVSGSL